MIQPRSDYLVIEKIQNNMSAGGIVLPDAPAGGDDCYDAKILAVGPHVQDLQVGDKVVIGANMGIEYKPEKVELVRELYVLATKK